GHLLDKEASTIRCYDTHMSSMFCPQCGRELSLDSGDVRFCRYCGLSLVDTREELQGYSRQKRTGFSVVTWSYALLLFVTLLLHGSYIPIAGGWGYWVSAVLIVVSVSLFASAAVSAMKPQLFAKRAKGTLGQPRSTTELQSENPDRLPAGNREIVSARVEGSSVTEATTKRLV
ncbi:MAG TPA: zinc ribbon domain-containing protein, partial [Pyrinomonadaceae bacterium]|nr:zinc ribbon domain-containing protein [Pyrinomonadaceae bacterium]